MKASNDLTDSFLQLTRSYDGLIRKIAGLYADNAEDRKDLAAEIVLQLWRSYPRYTGAAKESTWLYRVALNTAITRHRSDRRRPAISFDEAQILNLPENTDPNTGALARLHAVIACLPQLERALILLYLEDRSHAEMAEIMGISVSNVGTRLARIREKLRKMMATV